MFNLQKDGIKVQLNYLRGKEGVPQPLARSGLAFFLPKCSEHELAAGTVRGY